MTRRFKLRIGLQLPPGSKGRYLEAGTEATQDELAGLDADALVKGNFLEEMKTERPCPACQEDKDASKAKKAKNYDTVQDLRDHYAADHPALAAPAE